MTVLTADVATTYPTRNSLPALTRAQAAGLLNRRLADAADLCAEISRCIDKWLWFVEAHLQTVDNRAIRN
jgi:hypothetical protein